MKALATFTVVWLALGVEGSDIVGTKGANCNEFACLGLAAVNDKAGRCVRADGTSCVIPCAGAPTPKQGEASCEASLASEGSTPVVPSGATPRVTRLADGMKGYTDMDNSRFLNFPPTMIGRWAQVPTVRTKSGFEMHMTCSANQGGPHKMCDHFVVMYSCPPCEVADGGNLQANLLVQGFKPFRCGVALDLDVNEKSHLHSLVVYHRAAKEGETDVVKMTTDMEFTFFAYSAATADCSSYHDEGSCHTSIPGECAWTSGVCERHLCPKMHKPNGPWPTVNKCRVCVHDPSEEKYLPALPPSGGNGFPPPPPLKPSPGSGFPPPPPLSPGNNFPPPPPLR
eukprot:TRINITY_DN1122_c0_g1_i4.p1 TRINITY_DN1122_c0_g1~~TRINITY_DN1122_c0_g1_i4.p1  ORF type:complete len:340 (+),score=86.62 TRINITY_DN1122_c0_g1_i4:61-1080(+)